MPFKIWAVGEEVLAADFNDYVQEQVVATFPNAAGRDAGWASPPDGALCVTLDTSQLWQRIAGAWLPQGAGQQVGFAYNTADTAVTTGGVIVLSAPFTALAGHRYWMHADLQFGVSAGSGALNYGLTLDGGAATVNRSTSWGVGGATAGPVATIGGVTNPLTAGPHTLTLSAAATTAGLYYQDGYLTVVDVGT